MGEMSGSEITFQFFLVGDFDDERIESTGVMFILFIISSSLSLSFFVVFLWYLGPINF